MLKKIFFLVIILFGISFVYGNGCCFDPSSGLCAMNTPTTSCSTSWSGNPSCSSLDDCDLGCCVLGTGTSYVTQRTCELEARALGFEKEWQSGVTEEQCSSLAGGNILGACVYEGEYENECQFIEQSKCGGTFHEGIVCSEESLNTICEKTEKTKCFEDDGVYFVDSCGNRDVLSEQCDYDSGTTCRQKSSTEAYCKDLNCKGGRKNGESWCIGLDGKLLIEDIRNIEVKKAGEKPEGFQDTVGSRFYKQICIDGEVITEPCADYRNEVCIPSGKTAKCIANEGSLCAEANVLDEESGEVSVEDCNEEWCFVTRLDDCVQFKGAEEMTCGEDRQNWESYGEENGYSTEGVSEVSSPLMEQLNLPICAPKVTIGNGLSSQGSSEGKEGGICMAGNYEGEMTIHQSKSCGYFDEFFCNSETKCGLISLLLGESDGCTNEDDCGCDFDVSVEGDWLTTDYKETWYLAELKNFEYEKIRPLLGGVAQELDPMVGEKIAERCMAVGDCGEKANWAGASSGSAEVGLIEGASSEGGRTWTVGYSFECDSWTAPGSGDCNKCGADNLPCSEYRCQALGKNCEYVEPNGIDTGVCVSSNDAQPPSISHTQDPANPIPPYESVIITLKTNEDSYCKFDFSSSGGTIENMKYDTDGTFGREHQFVLSVPGKSVYDEDLEEYSVLNRDGKYDIFVRCEDGAGNYNLNPHIVKLEVMNTPDKVPATISKFVPPSGSFVKYNTTTKSMKFQLNEPTECRWSFTNIEYSQMGELEEQEDDDPINNHQFLCDLAITNDSFVNGYWCSGILPNVTLEIGESTKYYIRCYDQPWLEGIESPYYSRNLNTQSFEYILKPSLPLEISDVSPASGNFVTGSSIGNITYQVKTKDGAERGKAQCEWRLRSPSYNSSWQFFGTTNSSTHQQLLSGLNSTEYNVDVRCEDVAGNKAEVSSILNVLIDTNPPTLTRGYNDKGNIKISLNEDGSCKFSNKGGCSFVGTNGTLMSSRELLEHITSLKKGLPFYIRCEDSFGNSRCFDVLLFH